MRNYLYILVTLVQLVVWDVALRIRYALSPANARAHVDAVAAAYARRVFALGRLFVGLRIRTTGLKRPDLPPQFTIIANHQSFFDIVALMASFPRHSVRFVSKRQLGSFYVPAASRVLRYQRHALINRHGDFSATMHHLQAFARHSYAVGACPVIFPEGTRSRTGRLLPFHTGAARMVMAAAPLPVACVAMDGGYRFSRIIDVRRARNIEFHLKLLWVAPAPRTKAEILDIVERAADSIQAQVDSWRLTS